MKNGILLSGGTGTRLAPLTHVVNKHLLGVNGKFIIDYPLNTLKRMGVENCTVVLGGNHFSQVVDHLQDGKHHGMKFNYVYQGEAKGIAQAINLCQRYVDDEGEFTVILGDNIFEEPVQWLADDYLPRAQIILKEVNDPSRFGVAFVNQLGIRKIEEKPRVLDPNYTCLAITGCYRFTHDYFSFFRDLTPSARGEYEVVDIIKRYLDSGELLANTYDGFWSDAGTHESIARCNAHFYKG
jgi:glucose-1-phosphate thymidylyltransferase